MSATVVDFPIKIIKGGAAPSTEPPLSKYQNEHPGTESPGGKSLKRRYPGEWNCFKNMKQRAKQPGWSVHPALARFKDFLKHVGPKPCAEATLDRLNPADHEYAPGKVRWATKKQQANNRTNTTYLAFQGRRLPLTEWAEVLGLHADLIRSRLREGWSDAEALTGERLPRQERFLRAESLGQVAARLRHQGIIRSDEPMPFSMYRTLRWVLDSALEEFENNGGEDLESRLQQLAREATATLPHLLAIVRSMRGGEYLVDAIQRRGNPTRTGHISELVNAN